MLKPGDLVRVKPYNEIVIHPYVSFIDDMKIFCGGEFTVLQPAVLHDETFYFLESCTSDRDNYYYFVEDWVELVERIEINDEEFLGVFDV